MAKDDGEEIKHDVSAELPVVESPPLSPAGASSETPVDAEDEAVAYAPSKSRAGFRLSRRYQRRATLAVWLALVAGLGALFGGAISNGLTGHGRADVAGLAQRKAMQQSIDHLAKQVSELKAKLAVAAAAPHSQTAKLSNPADRTSGPLVTGSIPTARAKPVPLPRPRIAAAVSRPAVVQNWRILRSRGGLVDVEGRDGVYEVVPGAVLPGLGPVQSIERRNGRWMVVTPKGIIVSARDRGYFKDF